MEQDNIELIKIGLQMEQDNIELIKIGLQNVVEICDKTTSGNIAHQIPSIKFIASSLIKVCNNEL